MSGWGRWGDYQKGPKAPPPAHGIKLKKLGTTWWGQRWIEALEEVLGGDAGRLARGRTYARAGRTHDLETTGGKVKAKVTGSRPRPYDITIELTQLSEATWKEAIVHMGAQARFSAELLSGQMPTEIDEAFHSGGFSLFPAERAELVTTCTCPDWGDPCKHVAATHYVLGEALDRDPFLLFELRGKTRDEVLAALRLARGGKAAATKSRVAEVQTVTLGKLTEATYDRGSEALPSLRFSFEAPSSHGAVLRQLGEPAGWNGVHSAVETLSPLVRAAAEAARRIAMEESQEPPSLRPPSRGRRKRSS